LSSSSPDSDFHTQLESTLTRNWMRRGLLAWCLLPLALLFRLLVTLRRALYRLGWLKVTRIPVPVIVVGNLFVGGTGKTPLVIWLVEAMRAAGFQPGVISRGYGSSGSAPQAVDQDAMPQQVGDEPLLIAQRARCPVMVGRDRASAAQALLARHPQVDLIISDDGLQHYALARDIEIVLFDARGVGNGWMLPAGPLREPLSRPRDFTVINGGQAAGIAGQAIAMRLTGEIAERLDDRSQRRPLSALREDQVHGELRLLAAAGIGNPARFFGMLRQAGLRFREMPLPDHYDYADNPFASEQADIILITEKDAVKCRHIEAMKSDPRLWVVPVSAQVDAALPEKIVEKLRGYPTA
jgi:tetraacyldisaccharide 4'-kinase